MTRAMKEQDRTIVLELKRRLSADLQKRVIKFILYGSRARGGNAEDSDLDLVALVDEKTPEIESALDASLMASCGIMISNPSSR